MIGDRGISVRRRSAAFAVALVILAVVATSVAPPMSAAAAPPQGSVAVIGDFGSGDGAERRVSDLVASAHPIAVATVGDNVYSDRGYAALIGGYYGRWVSSNAFVPTVGNHDHEQGIGAFDAYFPALRGRHVYWTDRGGIRFFVLDSTTALASSSALAGQRAWLRRSLLRSHARWNVVLLHHPPYSSGTVHGSSPSLRWPFGQWGADLVLSGHEHNYERFAVGGTTYVVDGSGGKDLYGLGAALPGSEARFDADVGALFLTASDRELTGEFWSAAGSRIDRFSVRG